MRTDSAALECMDVREWNRELKASAVSFIGNHTALPSLIAMLSLSLSFPSLIAVLPLTLDFPCDQGQAENMKSVN